MRGGVCAPLSSHSCARVHPFAGPAGRGPPRVARVACRTAGVFPGPARACSGGRRSPAHQGRGASVPGPCIAGCGHARGAWSDATAAPYPRFARCGARHALRTVSRGIPAHAAGAVQHDCFSDHPSEPGLRGDLALAPLVFARAARGAASGPGGLLAGKLHEFLSVAEQALFQRVRVLPLLHWREVRPGNRLCRPVRGLDHRGQRDQAPLLRAHGAPTRNGPLCGRGGRVEARKGNQGAVFPGALGRIREGHSVLQAQSGREPLVAHPARQGLQCDAGLGPDRRAAQQRGQHG